MALYVNKNEKSVFSSVDIDDANNTAFFHVRNEGDIDRAKSLLAQTGETVVAQSYAKGQIILLTQGKATKDELFGSLAADGNRFELSRKPKHNLLSFLKEHGWKIRGGSSVVGQSMTLFSAATSISKADAAAGKLQPKFDPATGFFAIFNLAANAINYIFGGQKERDTVGLEKFDSIIADEVNRFAPNATSKITPADVHKISYMNDAERRAFEKEDTPMGILKRNSVRLGEVGLRTLGSVCMMFNIRQWPAGFKQLFKGNVVEAFKVARTKDQFTFVAGMGMVSGKIMGLLAKTYDPNNPPTTYWEEIRQKVLWTTSSFTEMIAQSSVAYDRAVNKRMVMGGKVHRDVAGAVGNVLLTVPPYPTRLVLPYGKKVLDVDEVQARLLDELIKLPKEQVPAIAARVTGRMVEHMGNDSPSFSELYRKLMVKIEKYRGTTLLPYSAEPRTGIKNIAETAPASTTPQYSERVKKAAAPASQPDFSSAVEESRADLSHAR